MSAHFSPSKQFSKTQGAGVLDQHIQDHVNSLGHTDQSSYGVKVDPLKNAMLHIDPTAREKEGPSEVASSTVRTKNTLTTLPAGASVRQTGRFFHPVDSYEDLPRSYEIAGGSSLSPEALRLLCSRPLRKENHHKRNKSLLPLRTALYPMMEARKKFKVKEGLQLSKKQQEASASRKGVLETTGVEVNSTYGRHTLNGSS